MRVAAGFGRTSTHGETAMPIFLPERTASSVSRREPPVRGSGSRVYSTILRYSVPRLMSSTRAASFLFHCTASRTRTMCARSASASDGSRSPDGATNGVLAWRNSISDARMLRPGADSAARETVLSSSRMFPGH